MKRGTAQHPKMHALSEALSIPVPYAVGIMQLLWEFAGDYAPRGDVGRFSDAAIARACQWDGDSELLIRALVECRWLDECQAHRLIVHDFEEHAEDYIQKRVKRLKEDPTFFLPVTNLADNGSRSADNGGQWRTMAASRVATAKATAMATAEGGLGETNAPKSLAIVPPDESPTPLDVLDELRPIYQQAGAPIPGRQEQQIIQLLLGYTPQDRVRVANYCKWAFFSRKWPNPSKTKALLKVISEGDWDVEITPQMLARARAPTHEPTRAESAVNGAMEILRKGVLNARDRGG